MKNSLLTTILLCVLLFFSSCKEFLLVPTMFFYFTSVTSQPTGMKLSLPKEDKEIVIDDSTVTILLFPSGKTYRYIGSDIKHAVNFCDNSLVTVEYIISGLKKKLAKI
jgi:hypothetical protein